MAGSLLPIILLNLQTVQILLTNKKDKKGKKKEAVSIKDIKKLDKNVEYLAYLKDGIHTVLLPDEDGLIVEPKRGWPSKLYTSKPNHVIKTEQQLKKDEMSKMQREIETLKADSKKMKQDITKLMAMLEPSGRTSFSEFRTACQNAGVKKDWILHANFMQWKTTGTLDFLPHQAFKLSSSTSVAQNWHGGDRSQSGSKNPQRYHPYYQNNDDNFGDYWN